MKKTLIAIAIVGMFVGLGGLAMAGPIHDPGVTLLTEVKGSGTILVDQYSNADDVLMQTKARLSRGTLNFEQDIVDNKRICCLSVRDALNNDVRMNGRGIKLDNIAGKMDGTMQFEQVLKIDESSQNGDELYSKQILSRTIRGCRINKAYRITQEFKLHPTNNPGQEVEPDKCKKLTQEGSTSLGFPLDMMLHQKGKAMGDYVMGKQTSNIGGHSSSLVEQYNAQDWISIDMLVFASRSVD